MKLSVERFPCHDMDSLPDEWLHPSPLPFIPPRIDIDNNHRCGTCKYDTISEKGAPCVNCIHNMDTRKDLWQPKGE